MKARGVFALQNTMLSNGKKLTMLEQYHPEDWFYIPNRYNTDLKGKPIKQPPLAPDASDTDVLAQTPSITPDKARDMVSTVMKQQDATDTTDQPGKTGKGMNDRYWWVTMY